MKNLCLFLIILFAPVLSYSQTTVTNNNPATGAFLGWNAGQNLNFRTNNINRMQLMQTSTYSVDAYPIDNSGFLGINLDPLYFNPEPFSLLHLNGDNQTG